MKQEDHISENHNVLRIGMKRNHDLWETELLKKRSEYAIFKEEPLVNPKLRGEWRKPAYNALRKLLKMKVDSSEDLKLPMEDIH